MGGLLPRTEPGTGRRCLGNAGFPSGAGNWSEKVFHAKTHQSGTTQVLSTKVLISNKFPSKVSNPLGPNHCLSWLLLELELPWALAIEVGLFGEVKTQVRWQLRVSC